MRQRSRSPSPVNDGGASSALPPSQLKGFGMMAGEAGALARPCVLVGSSGGASCFRPTQESRAKEAAPTGMPAASAEPLTHLASSVTRPSNCFILSRVKQEAADFRMTPPLSYSSLGLSISPLCSFVTAIPFPFVPFSSPTSTPFS